MNHPQKSILAVALGAALVAFGGSAALAVPSPAPQDATKAPGRNVDPGLSTGAKRQGTPTRAGAPTRASQVPPGTAAAPSLRFEPAVLEFGEMQAEVSQTKSVTVTNVTDQPLLIKRLVPSCGCTTAKAPVDPIQPGASVEIPITLKPGPKQGTTLTKRVTFQLDGKPPVILTVSGKVPAYVSINPELLSANREIPESGRITLTSVDGTPFRIVEVIPPIVPSFSEGAATEHVVEVDWDEWEKAGSSIKLSFVTDHPKAKTVSAMIKRSLRARTPNIRDAGDALPTRSNDNSLVNAARKGDVATLSALIAKGADVNATDRVTGRTALHWAAKEGRDETVGTLLKAGADVNIGDRTGKSPLTLAAESGHVKAAKELLSAGAAVNSRDQIGGSPVLWAAGLGNEETVRVLVDAGADVRVSDVNGLTPLLWAAGIGEPGSVKALLDAKSDVKAVDRITGDDALMRAARSGKPQTITLLLSAGADVNRRNKLGATALMIAAASGSVDKVEMLIKAQSDPTEKDVRGWTALDHAKNRVDDKRQSVVEYLETISPESTADAGDAAGAGGSGS